MLGRADVMLHWLQTCGKGRRGDETRVRDVQVQKQKKVSSVLDLDLVLVSPLRRTLQTATGVRAHTIYLSPFLIFLPEDAHAHLCRTRARTHVGLFEEHPNMLAVEDLREHVTESCNLREDTQTLRTWYPGGVLRHCVPCPPPVVSCLLPVVFHPRPLILAARPPLPSPVLPPNALHTYPCTRTHMHIGSRK